MKREGIFSNSIKRAPYLFLLPFVLFFVVFRLGPYCMVIHLQFFLLDGLSEPHFNALGNYITLIRNPRFWIALKNTVLFVLVYNAIMISIALVLAVLISSKLVTAKKLYRTIYFIPITMSLAIVALVFDRILARNYGFLNILFKAFGHKGDVAWLTDPNLIMVSIIIMRLWRGTGYYTAYLIAGLLGIPKEIYESSQIDGAGPATVFLRITVPLLLPVILFCLIMSTILSFQLFDEPWILNQGGPADASLTLQILLYQTSFAFSEFGKGAAISYMMTLIMVGFSLFYSRTTEGKII